MTDKTIFTIGHSNHSFDLFAGLLIRHGITAVADVRSQPRSRWCPHFSREKLEPALRERNISYVFLGLELGARSDDPSCYKEGRVSYAALAQTSAFQTGLQRAVEGSKKHSLALMCAEKEPLECHRTILVARHLEARGLSVMHIHGDGALETHAGAMERLSQRLKLPEQDMFLSPADRLAEIYRIQGEKIAYVKTSVP